MALDRETRIQIPVAWEAALEQAAPTIHQGTKIQNLKAQAQGRTLIQGTRMAAQAATLGPFHQECKVAVQDKDLGPQLREECLLYSKIKQYLHLLPLLTSLLNNPTNVLIFLKSVCN